MSLKPETNALLEKARHMLEAARRDLEAADADNAISRAYYAAFYAATAALNEAGLTAQTHKSTHNLFYQKYVDSGEIARHHSQVFSRLFQNRQDVDYAFGVGIFSPKVATHAIQEAAAFIEAIETLLSS